MGNQNLDEAEAGKMGREEETVAAMIQLFCRERHGTDGLCASCAELLEYARKRLAACPLGEKKPTCSKCHIHCYAPKMRDRIREVMKFSGPRMIVYHPVMGLRHLIREKMGPDPWDRARGRQAKK